MRKKIIAGNWKMNLNYAEAMAFADALVDAVDEKVSVEVVLAPPFVYLHDIVSRTQSSPFFGIAAQDCSAQLKGAFTGEVAAPMLSSIGIEFVLIGHSERRQYHNESGNLLAQKIDRALEADLIPIFCIGENKSERDLSSHFEIVSQQLKDSFFHLDPARVGECIIAYEPVWAIGTGVNASAGQAQEMHAFIRKEIGAKYDSSLAERISILYGGSVTPANAGDLFRCKDVDGALVGGASLKVADFISIIETMNSILTIA